MDGKIMLKCIWKKCDGCAYARFVCLRTGTIGWLFRTVFLNRRAADLYLVLASITQGARDSPGI